jgi:hypothetical protein
MAKKWNLGGNIVATYPLTPPPNILQLYKVIIQWVIPENIHTTPTEEIGS